VAGAGSGSRRLTWRLQRMMGLLITAVAVRIGVNGLKGCFPILAGEGLGRVKKDPVEFLISSQRHAC
jgi:hypothetical protein